MTTAGRSTTILLVEDNPDDAFLLTLEFEDAGVRNEVVLLEDGERALQYLSRSGPYEQAPTPGLVLLDLHLPRLDGHEVLAAVDGDARMRAIPIVVISVPTELAWVQDQFGHLLAGVLPKPVLVDPLCEVLDTIDGLGSGFLLRDRS
jgi:CheY-like chemotaxis protein